MISVVIATHHRLPALLWSLSAMRLSGVFAGLRARFVLVFDQDLVSPAERRAIREGNPASEPPLILESARHIGQNRARNLGIAASRGDRPEYILFLDDDATIEGPRDLARVLGLFARHADAGAIGLEPRIQATGLDQYYSSYQKAGGLFPVEIPCLVATMLRSRIAFDTPRFFFPEQIHYGSDEWALSLRVRSLGYQVYATNLARCWHRYEQSGRARRIRADLQYGHAYMWAQLPRRLAVLLVSKRCLSLLAKAHFETGHLLERIHGLFAGLARGLRERERNRARYGLAQVRWPAVLGSLRRAYSAKRGFDAVITSRLLPWSAG